MIWFGLLGFLPFVAIITQPIKAKNNLIDQTSSLKLYLIITLLFFFILTGIRSASVGSDTWNYINMFRRISESPFLQAGVKQNYVGFNLYFFLLSRVSTNMTFLFFCSALPAYIGFYTVIKEFCHTISEGYLTFLLLYCLGFITFLFTGISQGLALGIVFISYKYLNSQKIKKFIICVLIAASFHTTAIIFLIAYPLSRLKSTKKQLLFIITFFSITIFARSILTGMVTKIFGMLNLYQGYMISYSSYNNLSGFFIQFSLYITSYCLLSLSKTEDRNRKESEEKLLNIAFIGIIFQSLTPIFAEFFRISMYFSISNCLLLSMSISDQSCSSRRQIYPIAVALSYIYIVFFMTSTLNGYSTI